MTNIEQSFSYKWYTEVWNNGNKDAISEMMAADVIANGLAPGGGPLTGIEGFINFYDAFRQQLEDIHIVVVKVIKEDDIECSLCEVLATHIASRKKISFTGQGIIRLQNGRIAEGWNNFDFLSMYRQMGYTLTSQ